MYGTSIIIAIVPLWVNILCWVPNTFQHWIGPLSQPDLDVTGRDASGIKLMGFENNHERNHEDPTFPDQPDHCLNWLSNLGPGQTHFSTYLLEMKNAN